MLQITILGKDKTRRIVITACKDNVAIGEAYEGSNYLISVSGDNLLSPQQKSKPKESKSFQDKRDLKLLKKSWKNEVINKYPQESGSAEQIWKKHLQVNSKF